MKRRITALFLAVLLSLSLCSCGRQGGGTDVQPSDTSEAGETTTHSLTLAVRPKDSFHPALSANQLNRLLAPLLYEGLFVLDETFTPQPVLCEDYMVSADKLTWTFTLRSDVVCSDGSALTGKMVAEALNLARAAGSNYQERLSDVTAVTGTKREVTITLSAPNGNLPARLDIPLAFGNGERPTGTGPYMLQEESGSLTLKARADWWQGKVPMEDIFLRTVSQNNGVMTAFNTGDVTLLDADLTDAESLGYYGNYEVWDYATTRLVYLGFNTQKGLCADPEFRNAASRALDRAGIVSKSFAGHATACVLPIHPDSALYQPALADTLSYRANALDEYLDQTEISDRNLVLLVNNENPTRVSAAKQIAEQLHSGGLRVQVRQVPFQEYTNALAAGSFDLYLGETMLFSDFDLTALVGSAGSLNYSRWSDAQTDNFLKYFRLGEGEDRNPRANALLTRLAKQMPITAICFKNGSVLTRWGKLEQLTPLQNNIFFQLDQWVIQ